MRKKTKIETTRVVTIRVPAWCVLHPTENRPAIASDDLRKCEAFATCPTEADARAIAMQWEQVVECVIEIPEGARR
jgi:hypothetical protein